MVQNEYSNQTSRSNYINGENETLNVTQMKKIITVFLVNNNVNCLNIRTIDVKFSKSFDIEGRFGPIKLD